MLKVAAQFVRVDQLVSGRWEGRAICLSVVALRASLVSSRSLQKSPSSPSSSHLHFLAPLPYAQTVLINFFQLLQPGPSHDPRAQSLHSQYSADGRLRQGFIPAARLFLQERETR